ncbi:MCE family protein [Amycolatopsis acidicola]|uniref:MCE family protein n=1 Tax=Amycolatopsis acidicola TaxID=2596893 RepID=A0A5N0UNS0_9PSEU|nr:MlaD family protein [Amycolatopsis acidicola]KAA9152317.1 MCE family protein [Amycolatopsis acidicola]
MITRATRVRITVFVIVALAGIAYVGAEYAGLGRLFGADGMVVRLRLQTSGGIFTNAEVTYRGVAVGRVGAMRLTETGLEADLDIDDSAPPIPASARAVVADRSAVGEQYVDLQPPNGDGPYLAEGSVIEQNRTSTPIPPQTLLSDVDRLARSVPEGSLRTVVNELNTAFSGLGPSLQTLLDSANSFTQAARQHLPQTLGLISDSRTVLDTQQAEADQIKEFSTGLNQLAGQLRASDPDLRTVLTTAPVAAGQIDAILRDAGPDLGVVLANGLTVAQLTETRTKGITQLLVAYPIAIATAPSANPDGTGHLGMVLNFFDPMPCTKGYEGTVQHNGTDPTVSPTNTQAYCALPPSTGVDVRGANNAPG